MKIGCVDNHKNLSKIKIYKRDDHKINMIGRIIPKATELKYGKMNNTVNLDVDREIPINIFDETINKLQNNNNNKKTKVEHRIKDTLSMYNGEPNNETHFKDIFNFNQNNSPKKKILYKNNFQNELENDNIINEINFNNLNKSEITDNLSNFSPAINHDNKSKYENEFENSNCNKNALINSNLDGSFGYSRNSVITNHLNNNTENRIISDTSNYANLNEIQDKNIKNFNSEKQIYIKENNIFLNNLDKNNISSRNDFSQDEKILAFLFSVIDSNFSFQLFKKLNLNFYDFLNITKDELTDFKVPIKEKIRVLKLNENLKKFLEENINENDLAAITSKFLDYKNIFLLIQFFMQNKFLIYNHKFFDNFVRNNSAENKSNLSQYNEECQNINNKNYENMLSSNNNYSNDERNIELTYITTPNFKNISNRKNQNNCQNNNNIYINQDIIDNNNINISKNNDGNSKENIDKKFNTDKIAQNDSYMQNSNNSKNINNSNRKLLYSAEKPNHSQIPNHDKEIMNLLINKDQKVNPIGFNPVLINNYKNNHNNINNNINCIDNREEDLYSNFNQVKNYQNKSIQNNNEYYQMSSDENGNKEKSHYDSFRNEYEKLKELNKNYKYIYSNSNSLSPNIVSELENPNIIETSMQINNLQNHLPENLISYNNKNNLGNTSSIKPNNLESNKDLNSFKISNFSIKSKLLANMNPDKNSNIDNAEYEINKDQENIMNNQSDNYYEEYPKKINYKTTNKDTKFYNKENSFNLEKTNILKHHEELQKQRHLIDKITLNKTKSKIKVIKNSNKFTNNSNEISKLVDNYLRDYKELKERSENRQMKFNRILKNCQRNQNSRSIHNSKTINNSNGIFDNGTQSNKTSSEDREELILNQELNLILNELQINSNNFRVSEENLEKLKRIKCIIEILKKKNENFQLDFDFDIEEIERQIELEKIEKVEQRKLKIADEIKKCSININEKKKILEILEQDSLRNKNKSIELRNKMKQINNTNASNQKDLNSQNKTLSQNNDSSKYSEKIYSINNNESRSNHNFDYDYENEDLNNHIDQSSYEEEYYDTKNYSVHKFQKEEEC